MRDVLHAMPNRKKAHVHSLHAYSLDYNTAVEVFLNICSSELQTVEVQACQMLAVYVL